MAAECVSYGFAADKEKRDINPANPYQHDGKTLGGDAANRDVTSNIHGKKNRKVMRDN